MMPILLEVSDQALQCAGMEQMADTIPQLFDTVAQRHNRSRAAKRYAEFNFLKQEAAMRLADRVELVRRHFPLCLDFGAHDGTLASTLAPLQKTGRIIQADPSPAFARMAASKGPAVATDYARLPFAPSQFDAVFSCLTLHWVDDLPGLLTQMRALLKPDGMLLVSLFGGNSLHELRSALAAAESEIDGGLSPRTAPMADIRDVGALLGRAGLALPVADADRLTITYPHMFRLMEDLRGMGEQNALIGRVRRPTSRKVFMRAAEIYQAEFGRPDGTIPASFEIITLTGWAPHESQQKPLRPGAATKRLADGLDSIELDPES